MEITDNEVQKIADITKMNISGEELSVLTDNIKRIIDYVKDKLDEFDDKEDAETEYFTNIKNVFREDIPKVLYSREDIMANAPDSEDGYFRVPKVML